ncbi:SMI1/KNR4 family protein [Epilithonimonas hungarica]|uniref:Knr4/Smi1-like domain-containing protein n=1 Tax=Epilithonimonas hungarica TaxID=454006 RepID=A0A1G7PFF4_9FLAO|nr:hypothetical protein [Epilithonimonas hungarica]SDF84963.1 hypothetical protein SAMN05421825_2278 [Epilithonimonas hungarica]
MEKYNFRFVNDSENPNKGLTDTEIDFLQEKLNLKFPPMYIFYLQNAGQNSNVFRIETDTNQLIKIQKELRLELDKLKVLQNENILCIKKYEVYEEYFSSNFETYYFFNLSENKRNPTLYIFEEVCINDGWKAFEKRITKVKEKNFSMFINNRTDEKYGISIKQHFKNIPFYIISVPISIILIIVSVFQILKEKILSKRKN